MNCYVIASRLLDYTHRDSGDHCVGVMVTEHASYEFRAEDSPTFHALEAKPGDFLVVYPSVRVGVYPMADALQKFNQRPAPKNPAPRREVKQVSLVYPELTLQAGLMLFYRGRSPRDYTAWATQAPKRGQVSCLGARPHMQAGDFLVFGSDGMVSVLTEAEFHGRFERAYPAVAR